jgi:hypothetical protein
MRTLHLAARRVNQEIERMVTTPRMPTTHAALVRLSLESARLQHLSQTVQKRSRAARARSVALLSHLRALRLGESI